MEKWVGLVKLPYSHPLGDDPEWNRESEDLGGCKGQPLHSDNRNSHRTDGEPCSVRRGDGGRGSRFHDSRQKLSQITKTASEERREGSGGARVWAIPRLCEWHEVASGPAIPLLLRSLARHAALPQLVKVVFFLFAHRRSG